MSGARIITLGPSNSRISAASFEEAFGEYSNAGGRERRKQRKLERIENRSEVKSARQQARAQKVAGRQAVRGERVAGRTELQQARKSKRLSKREMGTESRLARKTARADVRAYKRNLRNPQEAGLDESVPQEMNDGSGTPTPSENPNVDSGSQNQGGGSAGNEGTTNQLGNEQGYEPSEGGYAEEGAGYDEGYDGEGVETGDVYDQTLVDETASNAYDMGYEDAQNDSGLDVEIGGEDDNYGDFDGIMGAEDRYNENQPKNDMPPAVQNLADKCVWNEMLILKLKNDRKNATGNPQLISKTILERAKRVKDLKGELENYANCWGDYSNADGSEEIISQRKQIVLSALNKARRKAAGQPPVSVTPVKGGLNPKFSKERIMIKSKEQTSNATGTGINGLDMVSDYDAPAERDFYIGADGSFTRGIDLGSIAVGVLLTIGFVYLNKQYKWIKL
jgi:hypothetical protein